MHGLGNNYVYIDCFEQNLENENLSELAKYLADVNFGIGSDGLILIYPSDIAAAKMRIFNKDGSEGTNCGNGLRCVAKYLYKKGRVHSKKFAIETLSGVVEASIMRYQEKECQVLVNMGKPQLTRELIPMIGESKSQVVDEPFKIEGRTLYLTTVSMGNPHAVFFVPNIAEAPYRTLGPLIEKDKRFPKGVNVEFISMESPNLIHCRVWERGSGVTQACGTGACAATVAAILNGKAKKDEDIQVKLEGGELTVNWSENGNVLMTGPAVTVASGIFEYKK